MSDVYLALRHMDVLCGKADEEVMALSAELEHRYAHVSDVQERAYLIARDAMRSVG